MEVVKKHAFYHEGLNLIFICYKNSDGDFVVENTCNENGVWWFTAREVAEIEYDLKYNQYWIDTLHEYFGD
ncbi:hypothetical protein Mithridates_00046 [Acinetobacter phage Mithridates]|nr:hypothetical protein Mithridates_00046 [Acinetobacter phage Mithridates]